MTDPQASQPRAALPARPLVPGCAGFTLLEVMVVVVIIAIIATMAVLSLPNLGGGSQLDEEMRRLTTLLDLATEEALLQGRDMGLRIENDSYRFFVYDPDTLGWMDLQTDTVFRERQLPEGAAMDLVIESRDVVLEEQEDEDEQLQPQIFILASGEATPFELTMEAEHVEYRYVITGLPFGGTEIEREEVL